MPYYPAQRHLLEATTIRRERLLPAFTTGKVNVAQGVNVNIRDIVARGSVASAYHLIDTSQVIRLKKNEDISDFLLVELNAIVEADTPLAARPKQRKQVVAPVRGKIVYARGSQIIMQETSEEIQLEAGVDGRVIATHSGRGVTLETYGTLVQGVWGNGNLVIGSLKAEPDDGLDNIYSGGLDVGYRGVIVITRRALKETSLVVMADQGIIGVIAPSMDAALIPQAKEHPSAIMLTEGFGDIPMSAIVFNMLSKFASRQATLDAYTPNRWETRRPEAFVNSSARAGEKASEPQISLTLKAGMSVRLTRPPYAGRVATVLNLPKTPTLLDNGLRVLCAQVELSSGERAMIPLANLESLGA
ncbi:MAG: hypothetical protein H6672_19775 [Anaerolineaceae bacterium]|nr:hypothetical protein [Anaerolineaceae bacterium]